MIKYETNSVLIASRLGTDYGLSYDVSHDKDVRLWGDRVENTTARFTHDYIRRWST